MLLDIRLPIGLLFSIFGLILTAYGIFGDKEMYARSLGININLWWGLLILVFGLMFLLFAKKKVTVDSPAENR
jgi:hypothetical protein